MDIRMAACLESKAADAKVCTAMLAETNNLLACGTTIAGETDEDKDERMQLMRMYHKVKIAEMRANLSQKADSGQSLEKSAGIDDDSDS